MIGALRLPLAASIAGHVCVLVLLAMTMGRLAPMPMTQPAKLSGIEIMLAPPPSAVAEPPAPEPPPVVVEPVPPASELPPVVAEKPLPPEPSPVVAEKPLPPEPPPAAKAEPPPPPRPNQKPAVKRPPPARERAPQPVPQPAYETLPPPQIAAIPPLAPPLPLPPPAPAGPVVTPGYRAALSAWIESHKRYPDGARARGEEGRAVLRFRVDRSGRVLDYAVAQSTGHADLDGAIEQMMRGARLPPFPAEMTAADIEVSVTLRFALAR